ncbi:MAG: permease [Candidatus Pacebacteria bacterium CG10_big_fil_rev_8_21_14_0_10_42_12]|nr:MAG: permease [Candidatus Pacebacteria bacterium CG10_big_fil_rev_8_21_14_0_10_42_12]
MDVFSPFQFFADLVTYKWIGLAHESYLGGALDFWIYDVLKISILLVVINYFMAITRFYFPMERVRDLLSQKRWYGAQYVLAAFLGVITPFCSCSSIPLFMGFLSAGIPLGVTFSFLIASPLVNESSLFIFPSVFGLSTTIIYNLLGVGIAVVGGLIIQRLKMERFIQPEILSFAGKKHLQQKYQSQSIPWGEKWKLWTSEMWDITKKIYPYVILGVTLGALIHGFVPESLITNVLSQKSWWAVPAAALVGMPLYANSISIIPIIEALVNKGVPMGTSLAFMTATVTLSIPEALMLKKILKWPLLVTFFGITTIGIILMGYLFNFI